LSVETAISALSPKGLASAPALFGIAEAGIELGGFVFALARDNAAGFIAGRSGYTTKLRL
jgi:hypothetical protein